MLREIEETLERLSTQKLKELSLVMDHQEWLKARKVMLEDKIAKIEKLQILTKESMLKSEKASQEAFFRALRTKNKQILRDSGSVSPYFCNSQEGGESIESFFS